MRNGLAYRLRCSRAGDSSAGSSMRKLRVLALHSFRTSGKIFSEQARFPCLVPTSKAVDAAKVLPCLLCCYFCYCKQVCLLRR